MENSNKFMRAQIWRWKDPIYGDKNEFKSDEVDFGEASTRYSRYVLIMQTENSIDSLSITAIPCSSTQRYESDLEISLNNLNSQSKTYLQPRKIFPVHPKMLQNYVCTLSEETMIKIESILLSLIMPNLKNILMNDTKSIAINALSMINVNKLNMTTQSNDIEENHPSIINGVNAFIHEKLNMTSEKNTVPLSFLKIMYDDYCEKNNLNILTLSTFTFYLSKLLGKNDLSKSNNINNLTIRGVEIKPETNNGRKELNNNEKESNESDIIIHNDNIQKRGPRTIWNDDTKKEFLNYFKLHGKQATSEKYKIEIKSAMKYKNKFEKDLNIKEEIWNLTYGQLGNILSTNINNIIRELRSINIIYRDYYKSDKLHHQTGKDKFYNSLRGSLYEGIIKTLSPLGKDLLLHTYDDNYQLLNKMKEEVKIIPKDSIELIKKELKNSIAIKKEALDKMMDTIFKKYCE